MVNEQPGNSTNGKFSESTELLSEEEIQRVLRKLLSIPQARVSEWSPGYILGDGRYIIESELNTGGFAVIYRAIDRKENQYVIIKILKSELRNKDDFDFDSFEEKFVKEAINLKSCDHPHIVKYKDLLKSSKNWCLVMEYIEGEDLHSWVQNNGFLSEKDAVYYIRQIGEALKVLHNHNLLHRDVKPKNIIRRANGSEVVLIDLGIAREFSPNETELHTPYMTKGFAPIEQYEENYKRGAFTDVYALAATLYFLLTNRIPTSSKLRLSKETSRLLKDKALPLIPPRRIRDDISIQVNDAILIGMQIHPEERPQNIQEWLDRLPLVENGIDLSQQRQLSSNNSLTTLSNSTNNSVENPAFDTTEPPTIINNQFQLENNQKLSSLMPVLTSPTSFLIAIAIVSGLGTSLIDAGFWLILAISLISLSLFFVPGRKLQGWIYLLISSLIPTLIIFLFVPGLQRANFQKMGIVNIVILTLVAGLLGFFVMSLYPQDN